MHTDSMNQGAGPSSFGDDIIGKRAVSSKTKNRILTIDTVRGIAMMLIIFSHTRVLIDQSAISPKTYAALVYFTNISTVSFAFVNGVMLSYFFSMGKSWNAVYWRFTKRALLLLACHPLIKLLSYPVHIGEMSFWHYFWIDFPITDTIAFCLLLTPLLARFLSKRARLAFIVLALVLSPAIVAFNRPTTEAGNIIQQFIFGSLWWSTKEIAFPFPILPWVAIDLCGSFVGQALAGLQKGSVDASALVSCLRRNAVALFAVSGALLVTYKVARGPLAAKVDSAWFEVYYPRPTTELLPFYLGVLLLVIAFLLVRVDLRGWYNRAVWFPSVFGRTSLFSYLTQFLLAMTIPSLLGFQGALGLIGFFIAVVINITTVWFASFSYGKFRGWIDENDFEELKANKKRVFKTT